MKIPRLVWYAVGAVVFGLVIWYAAPMVLDRIIEQRVKARTQELERQIKPLQDAVEQERQKFDGAVAEANKQKALANTQTREVTRLRAETRRLMEEADRIAARRSKVREEAAHVPDSEIVPRIRGALARLRGASPGPGDSCPITPGPADRR